MDDVSTIADSNETHPPPRETQKTTQSQSPTTAYLSSSTATTSEAAVDGEVLLFFLALTESDPHGLFSACNPRPDV